MLVTGAVLLTTATSLLAYATAGCVVAAFTVTRPTMSALTPALARRPEELTAVNAASSWVESISSSSPLRSPASCSQSQAQERCSSRWVSRFSSVPRWSPGAGTRTGWRG
jgi:hypothetical protein